MNINQIVDFDGGKWKIINMQYPYCLIQQGNVEKWVYKGVLDIPKINPVRR